jgi:DNA-binding transcriptional ArsR family regulator
MPDAPRRQQITDYRVLAALAHPVRQRLIDALSIERAATASALAKATDQAVGNVSHHLKVLAEAGLIVEAPELARDRRERWWRRASEGFSWASDDFTGDPSAEAVAQAALNVNLERQFDHARRWYAAPESEREVWSRGSFSTDTWLSLTPDELAQVAVELREVLDRWHAREIPDDGATRESVFVFANGAPSRP